MMGSNMAEAHPVGFRWPMKARERGATLIHVDPRFSRTSASCNLYVGIRTGTDIAFLGGVIRYILEHEAYFKEYVETFTNASTIIAEGFADTEDLGGIFSGYDKDTRSYESGKGRWVYEDSPADFANRGKPTGDKRPPEQGPAVSGAAENGVLLRGPTGKDFLHGAVRAAFRLCRTGFSSCARTAGSARREDRTFRAGR